jgi:hypothetical protein
MKYREYLPSNLLAVMHTSSVSAIRQTTNRIDRGTTTTSEEEGVTSLEIEE